MKAQTIIKDMWQELKLFRRRVIVSIIIIGLLFISLFARLIWLQLYRHTHYAGLALDNHVRNEPIQAARGIIYDRNGLILAENKPSYQLELVPELVPNLQKTLQYLVQIGLMTNKDALEARRTIRSRRSFDSVPLRLNLNEEDMARFALNRFNLQGVEIHTRLTRYYPQGEYAVHALGYVGSVSESDLSYIDRDAYAGTSLIGKLGIEYAYEKQLHGINGVRQIIVDAHGRSTQLNEDWETIAEQPSTAGNDLFLTLDFPVQKAAEDAVWNKRAAVVALDPTNGDVIALVSRPGFDPNLFARSIMQSEFSNLNENMDRPLFNRAINGMYPPGSTLKPVVALAGLNFGLIKPEETHYCSGFFMLPGINHRFRDWKPRGHGSMDMVSALAQSCDVYFYALADKLGVRRIHDYLAQFGLGALTGINLLGEKPGLLPSPDWKRKKFMRKSTQVWFPGDTITLGIGQGYMLTTPIQLAQMTAVIAARGERFVPRLVRATRDPVSQKTTARLVQRLRRAEAGKPEDWDSVIDGMIAVTHGGTATAVGNNSPYAIAGKSGTAQVFSIAQNAKYDESKISEQMRDHAWFIAFAPADAPRIAVAVLVENGRSGSGVAGPIARIVLDAYLQRKFPPSLPHDTLKENNTTAPVAVEREE